MRALLRLLRTHAVPLVATVVALVLTLLLWPLNERFPFALFIAAASIFLARQQLFPALFQKIGLLYLLSFLPLILMVFWLIRVRLTKAAKKKPMPSNGDARSVAA